MLIHTEALPDGRETLPVYSGRWKVQRTENGYAAVSPDGQSIPGLIELGGYQILEFLAPGGSSLTYKSLNKQSGHIVVLKEFFPYALAQRGLIYRDRDGIRIVEKAGLPLRDKRRIRKAKEAFANEVVAAEGLRYCEDTAGGITNDPRFLPIVAVTPELGDSALNQYHVIDTHDGKFLDKVQFSGAGRTRILDILLIIKQILIALQALHERRRVHLDLKPENIFFSAAHVNDAGRPGNHPALLLDFGSSLPVNEHGFIETDGTDNVYLTTTRKFAAPEVINGDYDRIGFRSDVYSVFVIMRGLLLSDVEMDDDELPSHDIRQSQSVRMLTEGEQEMLSGLLYRGLSRREFSSTGDFIRELDVMLDVLRCGGVHPAILRASAERFSKTFSSRPARNGPTIYYDDVIIE